MARTPMDSQDSSARAGTPSRYIIETANGSQYFTITGYALAKGMGVGKYIASESFTAGGYQWAIYFYPDGNNHDSSLYVSVFVALVSEGTDVRAVFDLTLLDQSGKAKFESTLLDQSSKAKQVQSREAKHNVHCHFDPSLHRGPYGQYLGKTCGHGHFYRQAMLETSVFKAPMFEPSTFTYRSKNKKLGYSRFYLRTELETSDYLQNDTLAMICSVGVILPTTQGPKLYSIPVPKPDLGQNFGALLDSVEDDVTCGDVAFEVDGEVFQAHKMVLAARSPVFKAQFCGPMRDENSCKIHIEDMEALVFKAMLYFIYKDELPNTDKVIGSTSLSSSTLLAQHLLVAADRYGLDRLKLLCESKLCEDLSMDTVATTLAFADQHHACQLKAVCLKYALANLAALMQSDGVKYLQDNCPSLQSELLRAIAGLHEDVAGLDENAGSGCKNKGGQLLDGINRTGRPLRQRLRRFLSNIFCPSRHA